MRTIELNTYEYSDLINYLEKLKELIRTNKRVESSNPHDRWDNTNYDIMKIDRLLDIVQGKVFSEGYFRQKPKPSQQKDDDSDDLFSFLKDQEVYMNVELLKTIIICGTVCFCFWIMYRKK